MAAPIPSLAQNAVLVESTPMPEGAEQVRGYDFRVGQPVDYHAILQAFKTSGFQATNFGLAVERVNEMVCTHSSLAMTSSFISFL